MTRFESLGLNTDGFVGGLGWDLIPKSLFFFFFSKKIKNKKINPTLTRLRETHPQQLRRREREREFEFMKS